MVIFQAPAGFLFPNLPVWPEIALQKNPEDVTRNVRSLAGLSCFFAFSGGCFCCFLSKDGNENPMVELFQCLWLSTKT